MRERELAGRKGAHRVAGRGGRDQRPLGRQQALDADRTARVNARRGNADLQTDEGKTETAYDGSFLHT